MGPKACQIERRGGEPFTRPRSRHGLVPKDPAHAEPVEQTAEAALATVPADRLTGSALTSATVLAELGRRVRTLDGTAPLAGAGR
jgi:hypothetical protein